VQRRAQPPGRVTLLIEGLLIVWLAEATVQDRGAVLQRLALAVERLLPPE